MKPRRTRISDKAPIARPLCAALLAKRKDAIVERFLEGIDCPRLKRAFAAAGGIAEVEKIPARRPHKWHDNVFRGLTSRNANAESFSIWDKTLD